MLNNTRRGVQIKVNKPPVNAPEDNLLIESLRNEIGVLTRRLDSKMEALAILSSELERTRLDRDQFRAMLEQLRDAHPNKASWSSVTSDAGLRHQLATSRHQCAQLEQMVTELSQKMEEVCGDMMVLRRDAVRDRSALALPAADQIEERQMMVDKMERLQSQCDQLRRDLEQLLDEKEEIVTQRDAFKAKAHRLNHQLAVALAAPPGTAPDLDALVTENRQLQEQVACSQAEVERLTSSCSKYKGLVEARKQKGILRRSGSESSATVLTKRQVEELLRSGRGQAAADGPAALADLRSLCAAMLEQLQDKCTALTHQRRANRLLAERYADMRRLAEKHGVPIQPAASLMQGYSATNVDRESDQLLAAPEPGTSAAQQRGPPASAKEEPAPATWESDDVTASSGSSGACSGAPTSGPASPHGPLRRRSPPSDEEILSLEQLDEYMRSARSPRHRASAPAGDQQPDVRVLRRSAAGTAAAGSSAAEPPPVGSQGELDDLPGPLNMLYRRALDELRAGEQAM